VTRNIGVSLSIVLGGVIFQNGMSHQSSALKSQGLPEDLVDQLSGPDAATNIGLIAGIADPKQQLAVKQAFAWSLRNLWVMCAGMAGACLLAAALVTQKELSREHRETKTGINMEKEDAVAGVDERAGGNECQERRF
jgi:hypothetical protein